eukprot:GFKZ01008172.1.p1 GENE.GFKZ01008172.1~~GFKZ01008172.1.p1  ORF type:complete len:348 (+),score=48.31 GFKZ01008172.1:214-1257(+)
MSTPKPLIVVLGLGEMGRIHAANLSKHRSILLGLASTRHEILTSTAATLSADRLYHSYDAAFDDPQVAAVVIATLPPTHPELICKAAAAKKHIFSEKPLGYSTSEITAALDNVEKARVRFMCGFMRRWDPDYIVAKEKVDSGELGVPIVVKCTSGDPEYPEKNWRGAAEHSMLKDLGVHDIDLARWLTGSEVKRVYVVLDALTYPQIKQLGDSDVAVAVLEMESGAKVMIHLSRAFSFGYDVTTQIFCRDGMIEVGELKKRAVVTVREKGQSSDVAWHFGERFEAAFEKEMSAFADLVLARNEEDAEAVMKSSLSYARGHDGYMATLVAEALVRSSKSGMPELVSEP